MKIFAVGQEQNRIGGGWSFLDTFQKGKWEISTPEDCDIYFVTSVSMLDKLSQIPRNKKIVLRVDNVLKNSTNGRIYGLEGSDKITRMEAMKQVAQIADVVIYQSQWAKDYLNPFLKPKCLEKIIFNGVDQIIFKPIQNKMPEQRPIYLYVRSSNHDNKGWHIAWYEYQMIHRGNPNSQLWIAGRFSPNNNEHNFDFFNGEKWKYWGMVDRPTMAFLYQNADVLLFPFWNDACSNTLIEAISSGLSIKLLSASDSGGTPEIIKKFEQQGREYFSQERMLNEYKECFEQLLSHTT